MNKVEKSPKIKSKLDQCKTICYAIWDKNNFNNNSTIAENCSYKGSFLVLM